MNFKIVLTMNDHRYRWIYADNRDLAREIVALLLQHNSRIQHAELLEDQGMGWRRIDSIEKKVRPRS